MNTQVRERRDNVDAVEEVGRRFTLALTRESWSVVVSQLHLTPITASVLSSNRFGLLPSPNKSTTCGTIRRH